MMYEAGWAIRRDIYQQRAGHEEHTRLTHRIENRALTKETTRRASVSNCILEVSKLIQCTGVIDPFLRSYIPPNRSLE